MCLVADNLFKSVESIKECVVGLELRHLTVSARIHRATKNFTDSTTGQVFTVQIPNVQSSAVEIDDRVSRERTGGERLGAPRRRSGKVLSEGNGISFS